VTSRYAIAVVQSPNLGKAARSFAFAAGQPSPTEETYRRRVLGVFQGHWRAGGATEPGDSSASLDGSGTFGQSAFFVEDDGIFGSPIEIDADNDSYDGSGSPLVLTFASSLSGLTPNASWQVWITGGTGWTPGVYTPDAVDTVAGTIDMPSGPVSTDLPTGYVLLGTYCEKYVPLVSLMDSDQCSPPTNSTNLNQSPWHDYGPWLPPGTLVNGGHVDVVFRGRLRMRYLTGRPVDDTAPADGIYDVVDGCNVYFTVDPWSCALNTSFGYGSSERDVGTERPTRLGWNPETNYTAATFESGAQSYASCTTATTTNLVSNVGTPFDYLFPEIGALVHVTDAGSSGLSLATDYYVVSRPSATTCQLSLTQGGAVVNLSNSSADVDLDFERLRVVYSAHGYANGDPIHISTRDLGNTNNTTGGAQLGPPTTLTDGQCYYVARKTAGKFYLANDVSGAIRVAYVDDASTDLIVSKPIRRGSRHALTWMFNFATTDEVPDMSLCEIRLTGFADGRTAEDEQGVQWTCTLTVWPNSEHIGTQTGREQELAKSGVLVWGGGLSRTTPGDSMSPEFLSATASTAAPLLKAKDYFTAPDAVTFDSCEATPSGAASFLEHPYFQGVKVGDQIDITNAGGTSIALGTYYVHSKGNGVLDPLVNNNDTIKLTTSVGGSPYAFTTSSSTVEGTFIPTYGAYVSAMWDWGGNYDIVYLDADLLTNGTTSNGYVDYLVTPTYQGNEVIGYAPNAQGTYPKNSTAYRAATVTEITRDSDGLVIGEVAYHDNLRRIVFVRNYYPGEHIRNGDVLSFDTYRNTRAAASSSWSWTLDGAAIQTKTANALLVKVGPNGTRLSTRLCVGGPPTGDCEVNIRGGWCEITSVESR